MATNISQVRPARLAKKLEKPRPPRQAPANVNRHSTFDGRLEILDEIFTLTDTVTYQLANGNYDRALQSKIIQLNGILKNYGNKLEAIYKDQLDRAFVTFRNACRDEMLDYMSRSNLLELIELRAAQWTETSHFYKNKLAHVEVDNFAAVGLESSYSSPAIFPQSPLNPIATSPQIPILGPGELVKSSGKYPAPTKVLGKNYCKDEVVIRNADSGKVMGIKGRRVHLIEELSETVISFQRVNPGAKERLVQITGPTEEKINFAKSLIEDTIRRNASPVRAEIPEQEMGSTSSLNSSTSDEENLRGKKNFMDASVGEYKYTVVVGDESIKVIGSNLELVQISKLVLDEYFSSENNEQFGDYLNENFNRTTTEESDKLVKDSKQNETTKENSPSKIRSEVCYAPEEIIYFADSPLSRKTPPLWDRIVNDCSSILRKTPIQWYDGTMILRNRPQETDALIAIISSSSDSAINGSQE